jgi:hypothetical protein
MRKKLSVASFEPKNPHLLVQYVAGSVWTVVSSTGMVVVRAKAGYGPCLKSTVSVSKTLVQSLY